MFFIYAKARRPALLPISYGPFESAEVAVNNAARLLAAGEYEIVGPAARHSEVTVADRSVRVS